MTSTTSQGLPIKDLSLGHFIYGLMTTFPLVFPLLIGILINFSQFQTPASTLLGSHLRWQRRSVAGFILLLALAYYTPLFWASVLMYLLSIAWFYYRILNGWLNLLDSQNI